MTYVETMNLAHQACGPLTWWLTPASAPSAPWLTACLGRGWPWSPVLSTQQATRDEPASSCAACSV